MAHDATQVRLVGGGKFVIGRITGKCRNIGDAALFEDTVNLKAIATDVVLSQQVDFELVCFLFFTVAYHVGEELVVGDMVYVSGQLPMSNGAIELTGRVGDTVSIEDAAKQAELCAIAILRQVATVSDNLKNVAQVIKLGGFVTSTPDFTAQPKVIDGASKVMLALFGDEGKHTRFAVGVSALPLGAVVEIDAIFQLKS